MSTYQQIYRVVRQIPPGLVSSYGRVARLAGLPGQARLVGYALHALRLDGDPATGEPVPWWRVVNARGAISNAYEAALQRRMLEAEGVIVGAGERIDLRRFLWDGSGRMDEEVGDG